MRSELEDHVIKHSEGYEAWKARDPERFHNYVEPFFVSDILVLIRYIKRLEALIESNSYRGVK